MDTKVPGVTLAKSVDQQRIRDAVVELLIAIGEDPNRPGLKETPARVARYWSEFIDYDPGTLTTTFEEGQAAEQPVIVSGMKVHSLCEHHLLPFSCDVTIAYIPHGSVVGLSKLARVAHLYGHRLQLQERMVNQIAEHVAELAGTSDIAVVASGFHSCMCSRGIKTPGLMTSRSLGGAFHADPNLRAEVMAQHQSSLKG